MMKLISRRSVLAFLGLTSGAAGFPEARAAVAPKRSLKLAGCAVAGTAYYEADKVREALRKGDTLALRREPTNEHDKRAIEVFTASGVKLGYVPRAINQPFTALMDAGETVTARVYAVRPDYHWNDILMDLYLG